jgi:hypothetical protein
MNLFQPNSQRITWAEEAGMELESSANCKLEQ